LGPQSIVERLIFYPTIAGIFDRNWPAVYTIAIYDMLYTAQWRQR